MKKSLGPVRWLAYLAASLTPCLALAQDEEAGVSFGAIQITASSGEDGEGGALAAPAISAFSFGGPGGVFSSNILGGIDPNNRSQLFDLLSNESIKRELKLSETQLAGVKQIMQEHGKRVQEQISRLMAEGGNGSIKLDMTEVIKAKQEEAEAAIEEILLPEQMKRIRQLAYQIEIATDGLGESLINGRLGKDIGVHDQQKQQLADRARDVEVELRAAIAKVHAAARAKLFAELTPDQRKEAEALLGDFFQYEQDNIRNMIRSKMNESKQSKDAEKKK